MSGVYSPEELEAEIAAVKAAISAAVAGREYTIGNKTWTPQELPELRAHLAWLISQRTNGGGWARSTFAPSRGGRR